MGKILYLLKYMGIFLVAWLEPPGFKEQGVEAELACIVRSASACKEFLLSVT